MTTSREKALEEALRELREIVDTLLPGYEVALDNADRALALPASPAPEAAEWKVFAEEIEWAVEQAFSAWANGGPDDRDAEDVARDAVRSFLAATSLAITPAAQPSAREALCICGHPRGTHAGAVGGTRAGECDCGCTAFQVFRAVPAPAADALREAREENARLKNAVTAAYVSLLDAVGVIAGAATALEELDPEHAPVATRLGQDRAHRAAESLRRAARGLDATSDKPSNRQPAAPAPEDGHG